jgi:lipopolysaccharide O-acetyltransferase
MPSRRVSRAFVGAWRFWLRIRAKAFSIAISGAFASFGRRTVIVPPLRLDGEARISIGSGVFLGGDCWLQVLQGGAAVAIWIDDGTSISGHCVISAAEGVRIGKRVLIARSVYISDHMHAFEDPTRAVLDQGITRHGVVEIGDGAWLGENVVIGPGVTIGPGAVVGANSVVLDDVPAHSVAVGAPARVVRTFGSG